MPIVTRDFTFRMPGQKPPDHIVARLRRFHPTVRLVWNVTTRCWQLIELGDDNRWSSVRLLVSKFRGQPVAPTMENTVFWLDKHDVRRCANQYALDKWLEGVDERDGSEERDLEANASGMIQEGADAMWSALGKRKVFGVTKDASPADSPETR